MINPSIFRPCAVIPMCLVAALSGCKRSVPPESPTASSYHENTHCRLDNGTYLLGNTHCPAISYSGFRTTTRTDENCPTVEDIKEDMKILAAMGVRLLRTYDVQHYPQAGRLLEAIRELKQADPAFEMYVMLGVWIQCKGAYTDHPDHSQGDEEWNKREIDAAVHYVTQYPDIVKILAVGNEAMVTWQAHFVPASVILHWVNGLKNARANGRLPEQTLITSSDNWAAWGGEESYHNDDLLALVRAVDFISLHTYAFHDTYYYPTFRWSVPNEEADLTVAERSAAAIQRALDHQIAQYQAVKTFMRKHGIEKDIHIGETGWASRDNSFYGDDGTCAADEYKAGLFYRAVREWTGKNNLTCFYFQAFDEPWKSGGTAGSEGHFGLFTVEGKAKYPIWPLVDEGVFDGLTRGGSPIVKTHNGDLSALLKTVKSPAFKKMPTP